MRRGGVGRGFVQASGPSARLRTWSGSLAAAPWSAEVPGLPLPDRQQVADREDEPWNRERVVADTAGQGPQQSLALLLRGLSSG